MNQHSQPRPEGSAPGSTQGNVSSRHRCAQTGLWLSLEALKPAAEVAQQWRELGRRALEPNLFYEADFAGAAARPFGKGVRVLMMHTQDGRLVLVWPFRIERARWGFPLGVMVGWRHPFASMGVPLVDAEFAERAVRAMLQTGGTVPGMPPRALFQQVAAEGCFAQLVKSVLRQEGRRSATLDGFERARWQRGMKDDPMDALSAGSRSKLRQELRRLEKLGRATLETAQSAETVGPALDDYFMLEATGWKERAGTAITQSEFEMSFLREACAAYAREGRIRIDSLRIGKETLASSITFLTGTHAWYTKISYNEAYGKNSPGSQLVLKVTEDFRQGNGVATADSCAPPYHPLMRRFWPLRYEVCNLFIEAKNGDPFFSLATRLEKARPVVGDLVRRVRRGVKRLQAKQGANHVG